MTKRKKARKKPVAKETAAAPVGKKPLAPGEITERVTANLPESLYLRALAKAGQMSMSEYLRSLVAQDLQRAS